jgi:hypothetical protein
MSKGTNGAYAAPEPPPTPEPPPAASPELKARIDRYGEILAKAFDLAEAGLSLGLTVIGAVGAAAQKKILESRADNAVDTSVGVPGAATPVPDTPSEAEDPGPAWGITNRLPIVPGAPVAVSFSINNDNPLAPRPVSLALEAFVGEHTGASLAASALAVSPAMTTIAPMDFEKFVLHGAIAPETPPDIYQGAVRVGEDGGMRIPVRLVVEPGGRA